MSRIQFPTSTNFLHISSRGDSSLPLRKLSLIGDQANDLFNRLCQNSEVFVERSGIHWALIQTETARWQITPSLCGFTNSDAFIWATDTQYLSSNGVRARDKDILSLMTRLGPVHALTWLLPSPRLSMTEVFTAQSKARDLIRELQKLFPTKEATIQTHKVILPNSDIRVLIQSLDLLDFEFSDNKNHADTQQIKWPEKYIDHLVPIPAGTHIGYEEQEWTASKPFYLSQTLVSQSLYKCVMDQPPAISLGDHYPLVKVSWVEAIYFCNLLSKSMNIPPYYEIDDENEEITVRVIDEDGVGFRLPTYDEWCFAASAGQQTPYSGGEIPDEVAWSAHNSGSKVHPSALLTPNRWGLYDLSGNAWEWCSDGSKDDELQYLYSGEYQPKWLVGGSWANHPWVFPLGERIAEHPTYSDGFMSFRIARNCNEGDDLVKSWEPK